MPPVASHLLPVGHHAHTSTTVPSLSSRCPAPTPVPACRLREACSPSSRTDAPLLPAAPVTGWFHPPSPPSSSGPTPLLLERRSPTADTTARDRKSTRLNSSHANI